MRLLTSAQKISIHIGLACYIIGGSLVATETTRLQEGQTFSEHANDLIPLLVGIIIILGGATISLITWQFVALRKAVEDHAARQEQQLGDIATEHRCDTRRLSSRLDYLRGRIIRIEAKLGIEDNTATQENGEGSDEHAYK
jgi:hypothetical protein